MNYDNLINEININFIRIKKPKNILYKNIKEEDRIKDIYKNIIKDYGNLSTTEIDEKLLSMIYCDLDLLSDDMILYFLPKLVIKIFKKNSDPFLLYKRLEMLDFDLLNKNQKNIIKKLISELKNYEKFLDSNM